MRKEILLLMVEIHQIYSMKAFATLIQQTEEVAGTGCRLMTDDNNDDSDDGDLRRCYLRVPDLRLYYPKLISLRELYCIFKE